MPSPKQPARGGLSFSVDSRPVPSHNPGRSKEIADEWLRSALSRQRCVWILDQPTADLLEVKPTGEVTEKELQQILSGRTATGGKSRTVTTQTEPLSGSNAASTFTGVSHITWQLDAGETLSQQWREADPDRRIDIEDALLEGARQAMPTIARQYVRTEKGKETAPPALASVAGVRTSNDEDGFRLHVEGIVVGAIGKNGKVASPMSGLSRLSSKANRLAIARAAELGMPEISPAPERVQPEPVVAAEPEPVVAAEPERAPVSKRVVRPAAQDSFKDAVAGNRHLLGSQAAEEIEARAESHEARLRNMSADQVEALPLVNPFPSLRASSATVAAWMRLKSEAGLSNGETAARMVAKERDQHRRQMEQKWRAPRVAAVVERLSPTVREELGEERLEAVARHAVRNGRGRFANADAAATKAELGDPDQQLHDLRERRAARAEQRAKVEEELVEALTAKRITEAERLHAQLVESESADAEDLRRFGTDVSAWIAAEAETIDPQPKNEAETERRDNSRKKTLLGAATDTATDAALGF